ncbi:unnamed protein product, partial [Aphanomyces euteiches]
LEESQATHSCAVVNRSRVYGSQRSVTRSSLDEAITAGLGRNRLQDSDCCLGRQSRKYCFGEESTTPQSHETHRYLLPLCARESSRSRHRPDVLPNSKHDCRHLHKSIASGQISEV